MRVLNECLFLRIPGSTTLSKEYYFNLLTYATPEGEKKRKNCGPCPVKCSES